MSGVKRLTVWTNGSVIKRYQGQDKRDPRSNYKTSPTRGFRKMTAVLYELDPVIQEAPANE
jgi:hypothetical protein